VLREEWVVGTARNTNLASSTVVDVDARAMFDASCGGTRIVQNRCRPRTKAWEPGTQSKARSFATIIRADRGSLTAITW
jgi:hypothetical protein